MLGEQSAQRVEVEIAGFGSGMKIDFTQSRWQPGEQTAKPFRRHPTGVAQTENPVRETHAEAAQWEGGRGAERTEDERDWRVVFRLADEAHHLESTRRERAEHGAQDDRMQVEMSVSIDVGAAETQRAEARELLGDLVPERLRSTRIESVTQPSARGRFEETVVRVGERRGPRRASRAEREVQADAERGIAPGDAHGFIHGEFIHHQARLGEQAGLVMTLDGFVDCGAAAEVVAGEDEVLQGGTIWTRRGAARKP